MKRSAVALALLAAWLARPAFATDMATCQSAALDYAVKPNQECYLLCHYIGTGSGSSCGPLRLPLKSDKNYANLAVGFGNAPASCDPGSFKIDWCATAACATPRVPQTFATLTGVADGQTSSQIIPYVPSAFYQARFTAIADSDCTVGGSDGVDVFILIDKLN